MITLVGGTRPSFMKIASIRAALAARGLPVRIIHTGQEIDPSGGPSPSTPAPDLTLAPGGASPAEQTAAVLIGIEADLLRHRPNLVVVAGAGTSTLAAALAASKLHVAVAHVDAGLRARDWAAPEEANRILTDQLADLLFCPSRDAADNLLAEGLSADRTAFTGNVRIDALYAALGRRTDVVARLGLRSRGYAVATLDRPCNVDTQPALLASLDALAAVASRIPVVFPAHPRTVARAEALGLSALFRDLPGLYSIAPLGYDDFATLMSDARLVATDSGGVQEETTVLGVPCLTLREATDRPVTVLQGTNVVVGRNPARVAAEVDAILAGRARRGRIPEGWDGRAAERIADVVERFLTGDPPPKAGFLPLAA